MCLVGSRADCEQSEQCTARGRCNFHQGRCIASCRDLPSCHSWGQCTDTESGCKAASADDCKKSQHCRRDGACSFEDGACVAKPSDCKTLAYCQTAGCFVFENRCLRRHACSCGYHGGPRPTEEQARLNQQRAEACYKAAGGKLPGPCPPKP